MQFFVRYAGLALRSARVAWLAASLIAMLWAHSTCPVFAQELTIDRAVRAGKAATVRLPSAHQALGVCLSKDATSLFGAKFQEAAAPEVTGTPITLASAQSGIPTLAQAPAPGLRGCGLVTYSPYTGGLPTGGGENPLFTRSRTLLSDPRFGKLTEPVRQKFLGEWDGLHTWQARLLKEGQEILDDWKKVTDGLDALDKLGCKVKAEMDGLEPPITKWNSTCKGQVDQTTYDWCMAERTRLEPLLAHRDASIKDLETKLKGYNESTFAPTAKKSDEWAASFLKWIDKVKNFNQRLEQTLGYAGVCKPCQPYPAKTIGYLGPHTDHDHYPVGRPHLNLFSVNQDPKTCRCFWNTHTPDVVPPPPQADWVDLNAGFPALVP